MRQGYGVDEAWNLGYFEFRLLLGQAVLAEQMAEIRSQIDIQQSRMAMSEAGAKQINDQIKALQNLMKGIEGDYYAPLGAGEEVRGMRRQKRHR